MIAVAATGTDIVDLAAARARGIVVSNIRNYATSSLPEHVFALALTLRRNLAAYRADVERGLWQTSDTFCLLTHPINDLAGSTLGLVGFGALGKSVAKLGLAFGMRVIAFDPVAEGLPGVSMVDVDTILRDADVVSLHLPLTEATRHLIGRDELARMKPGSLLINTARGGLVDEQALAERSGRRAIGRRRIRRPEPRAAGRRQSAAPAAAAEFRPDAARRLGKRAGDAGAG